MSDSGWVPRIAKNEPGLGGDTGVERFVPPFVELNVSPRWLLPNPEEINEYIEDRGCSVAILVDDIIEYWAKRTTLFQPKYKDYKILLGAIVAAVRSDVETKKRYEAMRESDEQMQLVAAENRMNQMIEQDAYKAQAPALIRFALERRDHRYAKSNTPVNEEELDAIAKLRDMQFGKKPSRAPEQQ